MKNYLIVGGSSGIGASLVELLYKKGHQVFATYNTTDPKKIEGVEYHQLDVTAEGFKLDFLPEQLDGLAYCPGRIKLLPFGRMKHQDILEDYEVQTLGAIHVIQACIPALKAVEQSSVVLYSTVAVQQGFNFHAMVASSKGAIEGLTRSLAAEFAPKIRFNAIAPSITDTPLAARLLSSDQKKEANAERHPLKRIGSSDDIAQMTHFLLSEESSWMTAQIIAVDGGMSSIKG